MSQPTPEYDQSGYLPEPVEAFNRTGKPEKVLTVEQVEELRRQLGLDDDA